MRVPFPVQRLRLLRQGLRIDRDRPDLERLTRIEDYEEFCWAILPHAARTFAVSIALLPQSEAQAAAVAYLYARMLDSYEDLHPSPAKGRAALRGFAARFEEGGLRQAPLLPDDLARDNRDRAHILLVERCRSVDGFYATLSEAYRAEIAALVMRMATGMVWASEIFEAQGGVLMNEDQLLRYCHVVIGEPAQFVLRLVAGRPLTRSEVHDVLAVSVLIQLANVTRDIERDLSRGVAYHPSLVPYVGAPQEPGAAEVVRSARLDLTLTALRSVKTYRRLADSLPMPSMSAERAASVAMLFFTEAHYRRQGALVGVRVAGRVPGKRSVVTTALPAGFSERWTRRQLIRSERSLLELADDLRRLQMQEGSVQAEGA